MSRQRFIYPEIFTSGDFLSLSIPARLLFIGLFTTADDYGRGRGDILSIKAGIFPTDRTATSQKIEKWISEVADRRMVTIYGSDGAIYYQVMKWDKYQKPKYKAASKIPEINGMPDPGTNPGQSGPGSGPNPATGSNGVEEGLGSGGVGKGRSQTPRKNRADRFPDFWAVVRHRVSRAECVNIWRLMNLDPKADEIIAAYKAQLQWPQYSGDSVRFMKRPPSWLRKRRWEDEPDQDKETEAERVQRLIGGRE